MEDDWPCDILDENALDLPDNCLALGQVGLQRLLTSRRSSRCRTGYPLGRSRSELSKRGVEIILDHDLRDGDSSAICERLNERRIPFVIYSGYADAKGACLNGPLVEKPAANGVLLGTLAGVISSR